MLEAIIRYLRSTAQPTRFEHPPDVYREKAAFYLYQSVRPADGLHWHELSSAQHRYYRTLISTAAQMTDLTPKTPQETV